MTLNIIHILMLAKCILHIYSEKTQNIRFGQIGHKFLEFIRHLETSIIPKFEVFRSI